PTAEAQRGPGVHAGGDVDGVGAVLDAAPLAAAVVAGLADQLPLAAAAGAHGVRDHLAEERLADPLHLPGAAALETGLGPVAGGAAGGLAGGAGHGGAHLDGVTGAEHRGLEGQVDDDLEVGAAGLARGSAGPAAEGAAAAEEHVEDVVDAPGAEPGAHRAVHAVGAEAVVAGPLLRVGEDLVGGGHLLEALGGLRVRVGVRV